jgi:hypothetical protein
MGKFNTDFDFFWSLIENGENFAYSRYADGEIRLMKGIDISLSSQAYLEDKWSTPIGMTKTGEHLLNTIQHTESNYYYAISAPTDNIDDYNYLTNNIIQSKENITFANLWINANYHKSKENYSKLKREVVLICNQNGKKENFPFNVTDLIPFPDDCINFWETNGDVFLNDLITQFKDSNNKLFFISCGPISEIIIHHLYINNPNNTYVDVGSSIDEYVHGRITRPYMIPGTQYYNEISKF